MPLPPPPPDWRRFMWRSHGTFRACDGVCDGDRPFDASSWSGRAGRGIALKPGIASRLDRALRWSPAHLAFHWGSARTVAVLAYHGIRDADRFEEHVAYFRRH